MKPTRKRLAFEPLESRQLLAAVSIPRILSGQVGDLNLVPVAVDNGTGVRGATIRINYDPTVLSLSQENITAGTAWSSATDTQVTANVNQTTGAVVVFINASTELTANGGSLVQFGFVVRTGTAIGTVSTIDLAEVRLNEGAISVNPLPIAGADATDGSITVASDTPVDGSAQIAGFVYADTNQDSSVSSFEGISGVQVTLTNVSTGGSQLATTSADGSYQFSNLAAGNYRIEQRQPNAFIDGGQNALTVTVTAVQTLTGQNFRELGLKPAFVSNRLLTTLVMPVGSDNWQNSIAQIVQLAASTPNLNSLSIVSPSSAAGPNDAISSQVLARSATSSSPNSQGEGEGNRLANNSSIAAQARSIQPAALPVPQWSKRTKANGNVNLIDNAMATTSYE